MNKRIKSLVDAINRADRELYARGSKSLRLNRLKPSLTFRDKQRAFLRAINDAQRPVDFWVGHLTGEQKAFLCVMIRDGLLRGHIEKPAPDFLPTAFMHVTLTEEGEAMLKRPLWRKLLWLEKP